jgi:hypothetical protein
MEELASDPDVVQSLGGATHFPTAGLMGACEGGPEKEHGASAVVHKEDGAGALLHRRRKRPGLSPRLAGGERPRPWEAVVSPTAGRRLIWTPTHNRS